MAHPFHHSQSSVKHFGGQISDYIHLHSWMDQTKELFSDFRHRTCRHHSEGVSLAECLFGTSISNSDNAAVSVRNILNQHIEEDCGRVVIADDWLYSMRRPVWFNEALFSPDECFEKLKLKFSLASTDDEALKKLIHFFYEPYPTVKSHYAYALHSHSHGIFVAERLHGVLLNDQSVRPMPLRIIAEQIVRLQLGRIPSAQEWLSNITSQAWMVKTKKITR